jgi:hypothetical protein
MAVIYIEQLFFRILKQVVCFVRILSWDEQIVYHQRQQRRYRFSAG